MASMRDIKRRKGSIQSTQQITKAMKLVSTVKLQKAKGRAEQTDPYFQYMYRTVSSILAHSGNIDHPYLRSGESKKKAIVVLTSNRGLAGGYAGYNYGGQIWGNNTDNWKGAAYTGTVRECAMQLAEKELRYWSEKDITSR